MISAQTRLRLSRGKTATHFSGSCFRLISVQFESVQFKFCVVIKPKEIEMAKGQQKGNRETKKPKKEKVKVIAAAPSQKGAGWQPSFAPGKKK
jgi:hypothetical protein